MLDWIENHGEAFLSKHTGVGKSLHRARALQKRHEDFEEVAQVKNKKIKTCSTVCLPLKYMKTFWSGTEGLDRELYYYYKKKSVPRMAYFVSITSFYSFTFCTPASVRKKKNPQCYREWEPWSLKELLLFFYFLYFHLVVWKHSLKNKRDKMKIRLLRNQVCQKTPLGYLLWMQLSLYMPSCFEWLIPMFFLWEDSSFSF